MKAETLRPNLLARFLLARLGIDRAVGVTLIGGVWSAASGIVTLVLLTKFLSGVQQGYYYTFSGFLATMLLFDLGVSYVALQFASHERALLEWTDEGTLMGDAIAKARLSTLMRITLLWYGSVALLVLALGLPGGFFFFDRHPQPGPPVAWQMPWIGIVFASAGSLAISPLLAILEGCGRVVEVASVRTAQNITSTLLLWLVLLLHGGLYAAPIPGLTVICFGGGWLWRSYRPFLRDILAKETRMGMETALRWREEIWPLQWKIALSGISGYIIFQMFTPILFATQGSVAAGQMGLSLTIVQTISGIAMAWMTTKTQRFGTLIAARNWNELDLLFFPNLWRSWGIAALGLSTFWLIAFFAWHQGYSIGERILSPLPLAFLAATSLLNHAVGAEALYLRAHKQEPLLIVSLAVALLVGSCNLLLARPYGATGMMFGYFLVNLIVGLGGVTWLFVTKRRQWHLAPPSAPEQAS